MSQVISEFKWAVRSAVTEPLYVLLVVVASVGAGMVGLVLGFIPLVGPLVNGLVITPALLVATLGAAHAVRHGDSVVDGATDALERAGLNVIGAYAILAGAYIGVSVVFGVTFLLVGIGTSAVTNGSSALSSAGGVLFVVLALAVFVLAIAVGMVVQFVAPAAVVAGTGPMDSLKTAYRFVRQNLSGVVGFSLVLVGIGVVGVLVIMGLYVGGRAVDPLAGVVLGVLGYLGMLLVLGIITPLYQVGYFEATVEADVLPEGHEWPGEETAGEEETDADGDEPSPAEPGTGSFDIEMTGEESDERGENEEIENATGDGSEEER